MGKKMKAIFAICYALAVTACGQSTDAAIQTAGTAQASSDKGHVKVLSTSENAGEDFERRFTWNEVFVCTDSRGEEINIGVVAPSDAGSDQESASLLSVEALKVSKDVEPVRWFSGSGTARFDTADISRQAIVSMSNGTTLDFMRFGDLPDADADEDSFDGRPFFSVTISDHRFDCGMQYNPK